VVVMVVMVVWCREEKARDEKEIYMEKTEV